MNKIGILTGIVLMILGVIERSSLPLSIGLSLMFISLVGELFKGKLRALFTKTALRLQIGKLERARKQHQHTLQEAEEWIRRFALRYDALLPSSFFLTPNGRIRLQYIDAEKENSEGVFAEFAQFLQRKGVQLQSELLRIEINDHILRNRIDQFALMLAKFAEHKPALEELLHIFVEEEKTLHSSIGYHHFWNRRILLLFILSNYSSGEIRNLFSCRPRQFEARLTYYLQELRQELATRQRLWQLEKWLLATHEELVFSITQFDQHVNQFNEFRMGIVYLLEKLGYRVTLPEDSVAELDLLIERSGMQYGVVIKPLTDGDSISVSIIHEAHTAKTLANLQSIMVISNQMFTTSATQLARKLGLICIDRDKLCEWLNTHTNAIQQTS